MPTGYTSDLYDGKPVTPADFILGCARAFGALIEMRDHPKDAPIPDEFEPSDYHRNALAKAKARLDELERMPADEVVRQAREEYEDALRRHQERVAQRVAVRERYDAMLGHVTAWTPPTPEHEGLRTFMIEQLTSAIDFDCSGTYDDPPERLAPASWRVRRIEQAQKDIDRHALEYEKERQRAAERTEWVRALRESLPVTAVSS